MPTLEFFRRLGLLISPGFLSEETCGRLSGLIANAPRSRGETGRGYKEFVVDESRRSVDVARLQKADTAELRQSLLGLIPELQSHFGMPLEWCEPPMYLAYRTGDFFKPHTDNSSHPAVAQDHIGRRRVSAVLFLNRHASEPRENCFGGGRLNFYGLLDGKEWKSLSFALDPEPGLLVAYRSNIVHEVTPVTFGERYTIATAFHAPLAVPPLSPQ